MFQLAMYVATIREMFRPGVLWFLKDPNDPNFNAMRELLRRSLSGLVRKLMTGIVLYGSIIVGVIGGGIQLILFFDHISIVLFGSATIFKVFPLRLEY
jgi:E3 ubiquitin-protein ligase DOA10